MRQPIVSLVLWLRLASLGSGRAVSYPLPTLLESRDESADPTTFNWVESFAAIGDSYTVGVGAGSRLGTIFHNIGDWWCSRYDQAYPYMMYNYIGSAISKFQFPACFGALTSDIYKQVQNLEGNINLLTLTAGGNDLCLSDIIVSCVILSFFDEDTCTKVLDQAQSNLDNIVKGNIKDILLEIKGKMAKDGVVIYTSYAQFFNTENEDCANNQEWGFAYWARYVAKYYFEIDLKASLPMTIERRKRYNKLASGLNDVIRDLVHDVEDEVDYNIGYSDWDIWGRESVAGQMCDPSSTGYYPDEKQPDLVFFKHDTSKTLWRVPFRKRELEEAVVANTTHYEGPIELEDEQEYEPTAEEVRVALGLTKEQDAALRATLPKVERDAEGVNRAVYRSRLWVTPDPRAEALSRLDPRAPTAPGCPSQAGWIPIYPLLGSFIPDYVGRIFHPNENGQNAMASLALLRTVDLRAKILGAEKQVCEVTDEFKCWSKEGRKAYSSENLLSGKYEDFCNNLKPPGNGATAWKRTEKFFDGTPDAFELLVETDETQSDYKKEECVESMKRIIHGCDGNEPDNPMNYKSGGRWKRGSVWYEVNPQRDNRPWPKIAKATGHCHGWYHFWDSDYKIQGVGWANGDYGQGGNGHLLQEIKNCLGLGVTQWKFDYFDKPDENGFEWEASFHTPVFVNNRCFKNNKVAFGASGFTDGCEGSGWA